MNYENGRLMVDLEFVLIDSEILATFCSEGRMFGKLKRAPLFQWLLQSKACCFKDCALCYVELVLLYGSECWTISAQMESKFQATEIWFYRRMMKISWLDYVTNEEVSRRTGTERKIMKTIRKRQIEFLGHVTRKGGLEELMLAERVHGKRSRGRQRLTYLET